MNNQPSPPAIHPKVVAVGVGGAIVTIIIYVLSFFNVHIPEGLAALLTAVISAVLGYLTPSK